MSALGQAALDLWEDLYEEAGYEIRYRHHFADTASAAPTVRAVKGRYGSQRIGTDDVVYSTHNASDFLIPVAELCEFGLGEPQRHDTIVWTDDTGRDRLFRVGVDGVEDCFDFWGQFGNVYRVHATELES